jgi:two-component system response regulator AtoC
MELPNSEFVFGKTAGMSEVRRKIEEALHDDLPVLIEGESGTGKEVIGRLLHLRSKLGEGPFIKLNCGAIPARSLEEEIFGCEDGTAIRRSRGSSLNDLPRGTFFLDEIGNMDIALQRRLMQTLEPGAGLAVDRSKHQTIAARRFIGASSVNLEMPSGNRAFLRELLSCFAKHRVVLLPLRERKEDIPQLCDYLIEKFAREFGRPAPKLSSYALESFQQWKWPGNIRELENWIARIVIFGTDETIGRDFRRQLVDGGAAPPRRHRVLHVNLERTRRRKGR